MTDNDIELTKGLARQLEALHAANGGDWVATARDAIALIRGGAIAPASSKGGAITPDAPRDDD